MSDNQSWYARRWAQMKQAAPPAPFGRPQPQQYQQPQQYPQQVMPGQHVQQGQPNTQVLFQKQPQASMSQTFEMQKQGFLAPGQGGRLNPDPCPNCGGMLFIEDTGKRRRGPPPAPHCFTCGYNGLFEQGLESTWAGGA